MNRRGFLQRLGLGLLAVPAVAKAAKEPKKVDISVIPRRYGKTKAVEDAIGKSGKGSFQNLPEHYIADYKAHWEHRISSMESKLVKSHIAAANKRRDDIILDAIK